VCEVCVVCVQKRTVVVVKTTKSSDEAYCVGCHALLQVLAWSTHACNQTHSRYCKGGGRGFFFWWRWWWGVIPNTKWLRV